MLFQEVFLFFLGLAWIVFATVQDLKTREVANWLNFSLMSFAMAFRAFFSVFSNDWSFFVSGLVGMGLFFILSHVMYYGRVFAGGDMRLMRGIGAVLPWSISIGGSLNLMTGVFFILMLLFSGAIYSLAYSIVMMLKCRKDFIKEFRKNSHNYKVFILFGFLLAAALFILAALSLIDIIFVFFGLLLFVAPLLYVYAKSVEEACFVRLTDVRNLVEGDLLYKDVFANGKKIIADWQGLKSEEINLIKKHKKKVWVKEGIPFVPAFLIAYAAFFIVYFYNPRLGF